MLHLKGKEVLVVGLARSGVAAAQLLAGRGAKVTVNDLRPESSFADELVELDRLGARTLFGAHPVELFTGAELIVLSPGVPADMAPVRAAMAAGVTVISEAELAGHFLRGRLIGVTGSNGKTTTTTLIGELMRAAGAKVLVGGNIGTALTSLVEQSDDDTWTVAELSSFQLEMIDSLRVHVGVLTNVTPDHLDRHGTFESYCAAKHRIFANQQPGDWGILNKDDAGTAQMLRALPQPARIAWFSTRERAEVSLSGERIRTTLLRPDGGEVEVIGAAEIPLPGRHNVENVMAALAATFSALGPDPGIVPAMRAAILAFRGVEHRIEFVTEIDNVRFYNDSKATNVDSTLKALEAFGGNVILILGGKDKGSDYTILVPLIRERVKLIVLIGAASDKIAGQLAGIVPMIRATTMEQAVTIARAEANGGDTVLLAPACASFDMFENYEHRGRVFKAAVWALAAA